MGHRDVKPQVGNVKVSHRLQRMDRQRLLNYVRAYHSHMQIPPDASDDQIRTLIASWEYRAVVRKDK
jgi:hypothetical protein